MHTLLQWSVDVKSYMCLMHTEPGIRIPVHQCRNFHDFRLKNEPYDTKGINWLHLVKFYLAHFYPDLAEQLDCSYWWQSVDNIESFETLYKKSNEKGWFPFYAYALTLHHRSKSFFRLVVFSVFMTSLFIIMTQTV